MDESQLITRRSTLRYFITRVEAPGARKGSTAPDVETT
jgi:hypothetical protein